jgi:disulfide bond formation protein DsbB
MPFALFSNARIACALVAAMSFLSLAGALLSQYGFGMEPCILCLYQRWPHGIIIILGLLGTAMAGRRAKMSALVLVLCALLYLIGAAIAFYHVGVEQHWWASALEACTIDFSSGENLLAQIQSNTGPRCDVVPFELFGISMAGYNSLISLALAGYCVCVAVRQKFK